MKIKGKSVLKYFHDLEMIISYDNVIISKDAWGYTQIT